jgi:hypothetical protein
MRIARSTGAVSGVLIVMLGLWGALIPFIGPYFSYSFGTNATWHYTAHRLCLCILPGACAVAGGLLLLMAARRASGVLGGWLAMLAGVWYAIGPAVSLTWESGPTPIGRPLFGSTRQMLELVGYFYGLGALIVALAAFSVGRFVSRPPVPPESPAAPTQPEATVPGDPAMRATDGHRERDRRRGRIRRRRPLPRRERAARDGSTEGTRT